MMTKITTAIRGYSAMNLICMFFFSMDDYMQDMEDIEEINAWDDLQERQKRIHLRRFDPFEYYSEDEFVQRYRLSKRCFSNLLSRIEPELPTSMDRRGE